MVIVHPPFALMSRKPGIGANYIETHASWHRDSKSSFTRVNGEYGSMPRYYRDKIFKDKEGEWLIDPAELLGDHSEVKEYRDEIERLRQFHSDPHHYYNEARRNAHDSILHKSNELNKF